MKKLKSVLQIMKNITLKSTLKNVDFDPFENVDLNPLSILPNYITYIGFPKLRFSKLINI